MIKVAIVFDERNMELLRAATGLTHEDMQEWLNTAYAPDGRPPYMIHRFDDSSNTHAQWAKDGAAVVSATFFEKHFEPMREDDLDINCDWVEIQRKVDNDHKWRTSNA